MLDFASEELKLRERAHIHMNEGTSATLAAAVAMAPLSLGTARFLTSEA